MRQEQDSPSAGPSTPAAAPQRPRRGVGGSIFTALAPLESRDFRVLWLGVGGHAFTLWMEIVARNWLVWELTGSAVALGWMNFWRTIPVLFLAIPAGVVADRFDRRTILIVTQALILVVYAALLALLLMDALQVWEAYVLFFLRGVAITFNQPPRQALIPSLVRPNQVGNAIALQQLVFNGTRIGAPLLTGFLFAARGAATAFAVIVAIELLIIVAWFTLRVPPLPEYAEGERPSAMGSTTEGLRYVLHHRVVLLLLAFGLLSLFLIQPYSLVLPVISDERFGIGPEGYGVFLSLAGVGAVIGPTVLAFLGDFRAKGAVVVGSMALSGVVLIGLGAAPWLLLAMALVGIVGLFDSVQRVITSTLLLTQTTADFHGRVISLYLLNRGFVPIGGLVAGFLVEGFGAAAALAAMGGVLAVAVVLLGLAQPRLLTAR